jgi:hypothetical protein
MSVPSDFHRSELHRVVLRAESRCRQEKSQDLRIGLGSPAGDEIQKEEHENAPEQAAEQVEGGCTQAHRKEEQLSLRAKDGEGA